MSLAGVLNSEDRFDWVKGDLEKSKLPEAVMHFYDTVVFPYIFAIFEREEKKEVIERVLENLREMAEDLGPCVFANNLEELVKHINLFLEKKAFCQTGTVADMDGEGDDDNVEEISDDEESEGDDGIDHDEIIFGNVSDLIIGLARAYGNMFNEVFQKVSQQLVVYTTDKHPKSDRNMALGCLAETFAACDSLIPQYFNDYYALLLKNSDTKDDKINRNVAYSLGVLAEHSQLLFQPKVNEALALLEKIHGNSTDDATLDNILAASCRIVEFQFMPVAPEQRPGNYYQMIDSIFAKMPLCGDETENETVLKFAMKLYQQDQQCCLKYM